jgi:protease-4
VEEGYERFTSKAAQGRSISEDSLKSVASGRVWSGIEAKNIGLIDELGGLEAAITIAAKSAKVEKDYKIKYYPEQKSFLENILTELSGEAETKLMQREFGALTPYVIQLEKLKRLEGIQARLPYEMIIK